ncbi:MAG: biopolymer transporter ExbD [Myxococcales bacterium]|nr:biopolymer transporter ExbD [Myxococcales bacterium]HRC58374.1 biopolymer transporter ExbD [Kofleriaceae bacterium]
MGMNVGGNSGGLHTEINITPLIDVVLVLLIIFLVTMPITMKMVTIEVPRKIDEQVEVATTAPIVVKVLASLQIELEDEGRKQSVNAPDLATTLRPILEKKLSEKVVFVDFEDQVPWSEVILTMDAIRSLSPKENPDDVKVALKLRPDPSAADQ